MNKEINKLDKALYKIELGVSGISFLIIVLLISFNVLTRFAFRKSFAWAEEISYICFTWMTFFGAAIVYSKRGLIAIDVLVDHLPVLGKRACTIMTEALILVTNICMVCWSVKQCLTSTRITSNLRIPYSAVYMGMVVAFIFLTYHSVKFLIMELKGQEINEKSLEERS